MNTRTPRILSLTLAAFLTLGLSGAAMAAADHSDHSAHGGHKTAPQAMDASIYTANGVIESLDAGARKAVITHDPVPALNWPVMTMGFVFEDTALMHDLKPGDKIRFDFRNEGTASIVVDLEIRK